MSKFEKIGNWSGVENLIGNLANEMRKAQIISLTRWSLHAERTAKLHMSNQDLGWKQLKSKTLAAKVRKGLSENILIATSSYFQSITSWVDKKNMQALAGVKKTVTNEDGEVIADIARVHEFGSHSGIIPARPLWQPTFKETMDWYKKSDAKPSIIFAKNIKKYKV